MIIHGGGQNVFILALRRLVKLDLVSLELVIWTRFISNAQTAKTDDFSEMSPTRNRYKTWTEED